MPWARLLDPCMYCMTHLCSLPALCSQVPCMVYWPQHQPPHQRQQQRHHRFHRQGTLVSNAACADLVVSSGLVGPMLLLKPL